MSVARERERKKGEKKGKIGRGKDGGGKNSSGYFEVRYFRVRHRIKPSNQSSNTSPVQAAHICSIPFPSASFHSFFFLMRAHPRDQRKTRGKKKKSQRNPRTSRSRSKGVAESRKVLPFEALPFKLSKRARNVLIRELPGQTTRPIFPSSAGTGNFATREQVSPLQGDVVKNQSAL